MRVTLTYYPTCNDCVTLGLISDLALICSHPRVVVCIYPVENSTDYMPAEQNVIIHSLGSAARLKSLEIVQDALGLRRR